MNCRHASVVALLAVLVGCQGGLVIRASSTGVSRGSAPGDSLPVNRFAADAAASVTQLVVTYRQDPADSDVPLDLTPPGTTGVSPTADGRTYLIRFTDRAALDAFQATLAARPDVEGAEPDAPLFPMAAPNDPRFIDQWGHRKLGLPAAWERVTPQAGVTVAVLDTGIDPTHPDLQGPTFVQGPDLADNDNEPVDDHGHGTHVAGTIAALAGNGQGGTGIAPGIRLLTIRVLSRQGGSSSTVAAGIRTAVQMGARIINLSLGGPGSTADCTKAIADATAAGVLCVAAAGNNSTSDPAYPAFNPNCLAVGSTNQQDVRSPFSNFGAWVDIAAPGSAILSTLPGSRYDFQQGTSMAAPHVSAAAALLLSARPDLTVAQLRQALTTTGDPATGFTGSPTMKRVNLLKALDSLAVTPSPSPTPSAAPSESPLRILSGQITLSGPGQLSARWLTSKAATTQVEWGPSSSLGQMTPLRPGLETRHEDTLTGLPPDQPIYLRLRSTRGPEAVRSALFRIVLGNLVPAPTAKPSREPAPRPTASPPPSPTPTPTPAPTPTPDSGGGGGGGSGGPAPTPTPRVIFDGTIQ